MCHSEFHCHKECRASRTIARRTKEDNEIPQAKLITGTPPLAHSLCRRPPTTTLPFFPRLYGRHVVRADARRRRRFQTITSSPRSTAAQRPARRGSQPQSIPVSALVLFSITCTHLNWAPGSSATTQSRNPCPEVFWTANCSRRSRSWVYRDSRR